jgi:L,D-transpeptidase YcbB
VFKSVLSRRKLLSVAASTLVSQAATAEEQQLPPQKLATKTEIIRGNAQSPMVGLHSLDSMASAIALYEEITVGGGWRELPKTKYEPGKKHARNLALRERLVREGYLDFETLTTSSADILDEDLVNAIIAYQSAHGLLQTGNVGEQTRAALNLPVEIRLQTLRTNLRRIEQYLVGLEDRSILVNIPACQLETTEFGTVHSRHNVIAGKPERPTPALMSKVSDVVFNPFWNAPASIVARDIIPKYLEDPNYLDQMQIRVYDGVGGPEIDPSTIDWLVTAPDRYHFQQQPGQQNALATVKVNFPNTHMVYMHDTPHRELFQRNKRFESSGCVRVDDVRSFITWIMNSQDDFNDASFEMITATEESVTFPVSTPADVRFMYLTAWTNGDGRAQFRPDIYNLDATDFILGQPEPAPTL